jgi:hypothetical protein
VKQVTIKLQRPSGIRDAEHAVDLFVEMRGKTESMRTVLPPERALRATVLACPKCDARAFRVLKDKIICGGGKTKKCKFEWPSEWVTDRPMPPPGHRRNPPAEHAMELRCDLARVFALRKEIDPKTGKPYKNWEPAVLGRWEFTILCVHAELACAPTPGGRIQALVDAMRERFPGTRYGTWSSYDVRRLLRSAQKKVDERLRWRGLLA